VANLAQVVRSLVAEGRQMEVELERGTNALSALNGLGAKGVGAASDPIPPIARKAAQGRAGLGLGVFAAEMALS
jgi:hypothetical protein